MGYKLGAIKLEIFNKILERYKTINIKEYKKFC